MKHSKGYALVFAGGGAKGAYQIGAWKALKELRVPVCAISGASVGVLNAALFIMGDLEKAVTIWENMTLDRVVSVPQELMKDGALNISINQFGFLRKFWGKILKNGGLDTAPLKSIIEKEVDEAKIRKSGYDFGLITYDISNMKPYELFLEQIPSGLLKNYILGSVSLPGFQAADIEGKKFIDGGVHDNIPYEMIKQKGYKKIIVVDISGIGRNRRPDIFGTQTVYIKNSIDMGNILDFNPKFIKSFMELGYLDTLKVFEKIGGIQYFIYEEKKPVKALEKLLIQPDVIKEYSAFFIQKNFKKTPQAIEEKIREILPQKTRNYRNIILPLAEEAAFSLNIERIKEYRFSEFLEVIWKECKDNLPISEFKNIPQSLLPAKIFFILLKRYFA